MRAACWSCRWIAALVGRWASVHKKSCFLYEGVLQITLPGFHSALMHTIESLSVPTIEPGDQSDCLPWFVINNLQQLFEGFVVESSAGPWPMPIPNLRTTKRIGLSRWGWAWRPLSVNCQGVTVGWSISSSLLIEKPPWVVSLLLLCLFRLHKPLFSPHGCRVV